VFSSAGWSEGAGFSKTLVPVSQATWLWESPIVYAVLTFILAHTQFFTAWGGGGGWPWGYIQFMFDFYALSVHISPMY
jgi:hypothetical protein